MAFQFAHTELHSRKGGKSGSVSYVLDEAARLDGASPHVRDPSPAEVVWGLPLAELREYHDAAAGAGHVTLESGKTRKIRQDQNTFASIVMSFPEELKAADPASVAEWEARSVRWLQAEYGDALKAVIRHTDERHPHLHAYAIPEGPEMRASSLHPGYVAKAAALAAGEDNKGGDRAYRAAMRAWQDRYWQAVGLPCGLARVGPGRRRLTRSAWQAEQSGYRALRQATQEAKELDAKGQAYVARVKSQAAAYAARIREQGARLVQAAKAEADAAKMDRRRAAKARQEAEEALRGVQGLGARVGALWASLRARVTGRDDKVRSEVHEQLRPELTRAQAEAAAAKEALRSERATSRALRASTQELGREREALRAQLTGAALEDRQDLRPPRPR